MTLPVPFPDEGQPHPVVCEPCRAEITRWYDYRLDRPAPFTSQSNYDRIPEGVADNRRAGYEQWRDTIRYQQDLIRRHCAEQHQPRDLRIGSLFSGYGGLDMAVRQVLGGDLAWVSDIDPGACAVLAHHHPDVPNLGDITRVGLPYSDEEWTAMQRRAADDPDYEMPRPDWAAVELVDVLAVGFPCTDISNAGRHAGIEGKHSGLWSHVPGAIRVLRPRLVVLENVAALVVRGLDRVLADLAALGFDAEWTTLRASDVGACHRRERWFLLGWPAADTDRVGRERPRAARNGSTGPSHRGEPAAHGHSERQQQRQGVVAHVPGRFDDRPAPGVEWGGYAPAIHRWAATLGRPSPAPTILSTRGKRVLNPSFTAWMQGLPDGYLTQVPGLSRGALIRLCGNGVCPQQGAAAITHLLALTPAAAA